jgi:2-methylcitrate dehydratase PrpD
MSALVTPDRHPASMPMAAGAGTAAPGAASQAQEASVPVLRQIADLAQASARTTPSPEVLHASRRCLVDWLGVAMAGWDEPPARKLRAALGMAQGNHGAMRGALSAFTHAFNAAWPADHLAVALGTASHALDFDDTDYVNLIHISSTLFPSLAALGLDHEIDGGRFLAVFNAAYEAEDRIGAELGRRLTACGWHVSGVIGHLGSALACGLALDLPADALAQAMAIASTASSGLIGAFGTMSKPLQLARSGANGLVAARLAGEGFTGPLGVLEADPGFTVPYVGERIGDWTSIGREWGAPYAVLRNAFKPHASCMITHPTIDAAIALAPALAADVGSVERITCRVNPLAPKVAGHAVPATGLEGKFSVAWCCVAGLVLGRATPDAFTPEALARADLQALVRRVDVVTDAGIGEQQSVVHVRLADGRELEQRVDMAKGNPANPLTDADLDRKFLLLARPQLGDRAEAVLDELHRFEQVPDVGAWLRRLQP